MSLGPCGNFQEVPRAVYLPQRGRGLRAWKAHTPAPPPTSSSQEQSRLWGEGKGLLHNILKRGEVAESLCLASREPTVRVLGRGSLSCQVCPGLYPLKADVIRQNLTETQITDEQGARPECDTAIPSLGSVRASSVWSVDPVLRKATILHRHEQRPADRQPNCLVLACRERFTPSWHTLGGGSQADSMGGMSAEGMQEKVTKVPMT